MARKRRVDLSESSNNKLLRCGKFLETISTEYTPESCLKMMKEVCEVRNKALQGHMQDVAAFQTCAKHVFIHAMYKEEGKKADTRVFGVGIVLPPTASNL